MAVSTIADHLYIGVNEIEYWFLVLILNSTLPQMLLILNLHLIYRRVRVRTNEVEAKAELHNLSSLLLILV